MTDEYEKQWVWRGRYQRLQNTLWDQILADLFVASPQREYWHARYKDNLIDTLSLKKHITFVYVRNLFNPRDTTAKEIFLRRSFIWVALLSTIGYLIEIALFGENNILYISISAISSVSFYLTYERLYVPQALTIGVLGLCVAMPLVDLNLILLPGVMLTILLLYLLAQMRAR